MLKHILLASVAAAAFGAAPLTSTAQERAVVVTRVAPPPMREERMPGPRPGWEWAPGHWQWRHGQYVWVDGRWMRERRGMHWVADRWERRPNGRWELVAGHWERGGRDFDRRMGGPGMRDRDHDGVPNRYDEHPDNPYRR